VRATAGMALRAATWAVLVYLIAPALVAVPVSFTPDSFLSMPAGEWSLRHYDNLVHSGDWIESFGQSVVVAAASALLSTVFGTLAAVGLWRLSSRAGEVVRAVLLLPLIIPSIISAMAFYRGLIPLGLLDTFAGLILCHTILATPMVIITVSAALANFDPRLEQASRSLGAPMGTTLRRVILPSIRPGILAGAIFAFILSWDEVVVALFVTKFDVFTLPRRIWNGIRENTDPTVAAAAVVLIVFTLAALAVVTLLSKRGGSAETAA
jgi:putative spermidine/putrescine transport system permease protein